MDRMGLLWKLLLLIAVSRAPLSSAQGDSSTLPTTSAGLQVNFGDVSFAGGMSYDSEHQIIYVTGQVGPHSCFVGILKRVAAATTSSKHPTHLEFLSRQVFNERAICQTIAYRKDVSRPGNALLLSLSEEGGLLTDRRVEGSRKAKQYGGLLSLEYSADGSTSEFHPDKSVLIYPAAVTVPRSIANDPTRTNRVFVATMTSHNTDIHYQDALGSPHVSDGGGGGVTTKPNLTPGGGMLKYGNNFAMTVESIRLATEFASAEPQWRKPYGIRANSEISSRKGVTVNQILFRQDGKQDDKTDEKADHALLVVGSTLGSGPAFGEPEFDSDVGSGVVAGFVTKLDPDTGRLVSSRRFLFDLVSNGESDKNGLPDTYIEAVCDTTDDEDAIFVVGSYDRVVNAGRSRVLQTEDTPTFSPTLTMFPTSQDTFFPTSMDSIADDEFGDADFDDDESFNYDDDAYVDDQYDDYADDQYDNYIDDQYDDDGNDVGTRVPTIATPFIAKLRASTLETIWQKDFESTANARALGCGVDAEFKTVYIAGNVENGGELVGLTQTLEGDDFFLLRLDTADGDVTWAKQLGTSKDDRLAYGGSGLVVLEGQQGVLLMGDTTSNLFSVISEESEVFVVEVDADGNLPFSTEDTGTDYSPDKFLVKLTIPETTGSPALAGDETPNGHHQEIPASGDDGGTSASNGTSSLRLKGTRLYLFVSVLVGFLACLGCYTYIKEKKKREATERALVFSYLQGFDLEDIEVKQAATGGWHGTYIGNLAKGINVLENNDVQSSSDGSWDTGDDQVEEKLSTMVHASLVRDVLFMDDYDASIFSSVNADKSKDKEDQTEEKDGIVKDPEHITEDDEDDRHVDPWGTEII